METHICKVHIPAVRHCCGRIHFFFSSNGDVLQSKCIMTTPASSSDWINCYSVANRPKASQLDVYQLTSKTWEEMTCLCSVCSQQSLETWHSISLSASSFHLPLRHPRLQWNWQLLPLQTWKSDNGWGFSIPACRTKQQNALCMLNQTDGHHLYGPTMALYSQTKLYIPALLLSLIRIWCQGQATEITAIIVEHLRHLLKWHVLWKWVAVGVSRNYWQHSIVLIASI